MGHLRLHADSRNSAPQFGQKYAGFSLDFAVFISGPLSRSVFSIWDRVSRRRENATGDLMAGSNHFPIDSEAHDLRNLTESE